MRTHEETNMTKLSLLAVFQTLLKTNAILNIFMKKWTRIRDDLKSLTVALRNFANVAKNKLHKKPRPHSNEKLKFHFCKKRIFKLK
jgi:hypothetical protein